MKIKLFTSPTCVPCNQVKSSIPAHLSVEVIDVMENMEEARKNGVRSVPTLVVESDNPIEGSQKIIGAGKILEFFSASATSDSFEILFKLK